MNRTIAVAVMILVAVAGVRAQQGFELSYPQAFDLWRSQGAGFAGGPVMSATVTGAPYSAEFATESVQTLADGNRIVHRRTGRIYRDKDGRVRREEEFKGTVPVIWVTDPVAGTALTIDSVRKSATETVAVRLPDFYAPAAPGRAGGSGARGATPGGGRSGGSGTGRGRKQAQVGEQTEEKLADRTIEGVRATGVRRTTIIARDAIGNEQPIRIVSEEWTSPELQVLVLSDLSDPRTGRTTYKLTRITRADPDPALFKAPGGYTVTGGRKVIRD